MPPSAFACHRPPVSGSSSAPLDRSVVAQLAALTEAVRAAFARADAAAAETDPLGRRRHAEVAAALRLVRVSAKLVAYFARLRGGTRCCVSVTRFAADGRVLSRATHVQEIEPSWPAAKPVRPLRSRRGEPPPKKKVRITSSEDSGNPGRRKRGGQPGNRNRLRHGCFSRAAAGRRDGVRMLVYRTECLIARIIMAGRMFRLWRARRLALPPATVPERPETANLRRPLPRRTRPRRGRARAPPEFSASGRRWGRASPSRTPAGRRPIPRSRRCRRSGRLPSASGIRSRCRRPPWA